MSDNPLVTRYQAPDGQVFAATGEATADGMPLYAEAGARRPIDLPTGMQATARQLREVFGDLAVVETAAPDLCPLHGPDGDPCQGCGHARGAVCHPNPRRTA